MQGSNLGFYAASMGKWKKKKKNIITSTVVVDDINVRLNVNR